MSIQARPRVIQKLRWQDFGLFWIIADSFLTMWEIYLYHWDFLYLLPTTFIIKVLFVWPIMRFRMTYIFTVLRHYANSYFLKLIFLLLIFLLNSLWYQKIVMQFLKGCANFVKKSLLKSLLIMLLSLFSAVLVKLPW